MENLNAQDKINRILGKGPTTGFGGFGRMQTGFGNMPQQQQMLDANFVARKVEQFLASLYEVESASGSINVKIRGMPSKRVTFRYR